MRILFVCLLLLSGCLGEPRQPQPDDPQPDVPPPVDPGVPEASRVWLLREFGFTGCRGIEVQARVDAEAAQALLENDTVATPHDGPLEALARWRILECPDFTARSGGLAEVLYGDVALAIEGGWYRFAIFSHEDNLAGAWRVAGYDVVAENATVQDEALGPIQAISLEWAGYSARFTAAAPASQSGQQTLVTDTALGRIVWNETVQFDGVAGAGTWDVPQADPFHALLGDGRAVTTSWSWHNGTIQDAAAYRDAGA